MKYIGIISIDCDPRYVLSYTGDEEYEFFQVLVVGSSQEELFEKIIKTLEEVSFDKIWGEEASDNTNCMQGFVDNLIISAKQRCWTNTVGECYECAYDLFFCDEVV